MLYCIWNAVQSMSLWDIWWQHFCHIKVMEMIWPNRLNNHILTSTQLTDFFVFRWFIYSNQLHLCKSCDICHKTKTGDWTGGRSSDRLADQPAAKLAHPAGLNRCKQKHVQRKITTCLSFCVFTGQTNRQNTHILRSELKWTHTVCWVLAGLRVV